MAQGRCAAQVHVAWQKSGKDTPVQLPRCFDQWPEVEEMTREEGDKLAEVLVKLIRTSPEVRRVVRDCACRCPKLVVQY